jgi:leucyl aminopeptidase
MRAVSTLGTAAWTFEWRAPEEAIPAIEVLVLPVHRDLAAAIDGHRLGSAFSAELLEEVHQARFDGRPGSHLVLPTWGRLPARRICLLGSQPPGSDIPDSWVAALRAVAPSLIGNDSVAIRVPAMAVASDAVRCSVEALLLASDDASGGPTPPRRDAGGHVTLLAPGLDNASAERAITRGEVSAEEARWASELIARPANQANADELARAIAERCAPHALEVTIWNEEQLAAAGFGGILAVNAGSANPPRLVELRYRGAPVPTVALTGKGVTFDAGGICLKTAQQMLGMHKDMAGAASVAAATVAAARLGLPLSLHVAVPLAENLPGPHCLRPGDVITHYGGRTTEVVHTDAEGRLLLADCLAYLSEQEPDYLIDLATIGNLEVALGPDLWGVVGSDANLIATLLAAGDLAGEPGWQLPLWQGYARFLRSASADSRNIGSADGAGGAISSSLFLHRFTRATPWAHLDIAGPAMAGDDETAPPRGAPTRALIRTLELLADPAAARLVRTP